MQIPTHLTPTYYLAGNISFFPPEESNEVSTNTDFHVSVSRVNLYSSEMLFRFFKATAVTKI
jgi:hypothetical protein